MRYPSLGSRYSGPTAPSNLATPPLDRPDGHTSPRMGPAAEVPMAAGRHVEVPRTPETFREGVDDTLDQAHAVRLPREEGTSQRFAQPR